MHFESYPIYKLKIITRRFTKKDSKKTQNSI